MFAGWIYFVLVHNGVVGEVGKSVVRFMFIVKQDLMASWLLQNSWRPDRWDAGLNVGPFPGVSSVDQHFV